MKNEIEQIHELKEEANELINFGDSKEKSVGLGMLRVLEYWENSKNKFKDNTQFKTVGEFFEELEEFKTKLELINKHLKFSEVTGYYDTCLGVYLNFDNVFFILGEFDYENCYATLKVGNVLHKINMHPYNDMGGFDSEAFEKQFKNIANGER